MIAQDFVIRPFVDGDAAVFRRLNTAWITQHFELEEKDRQLLDRPVAIIEEGGAILVAEREQCVIGCVALLFLAPDELELAKMAVAEDWRRRGVGKALLHAAVDTARAMAANRIYLESNSALVAAIALYERVGFRRLAEDEHPPPSYHSADVFMRMEI